MEPMMDWDPLGWIDEHLKQLDRDHLRRIPSIRGSRQAATIVIDGQEQINFGSNDYLGLAADPRLVDGVVTALRRIGWGSGASPLITGRSAAQAELERHLAAFEGTEAALVFPSGFAANAGTVASLADRADVIFSDAKNHASLIDGCRLSRATIEIYPHGDLATLSDRLAQHRTARRRLIVTDGLFSMDGDIGPLCELVALARTHEAMVLVDEAHATGVLGAEGRGTAELAGVESQVTVRVGTLSKALGSIGGFVAGPRRLIDWLYHRARPFVFSTALPAACHIASLAALRIVRAEPQSRRRLLEQADALRGMLRQQGWQLPPSAAQIISIRIGDAEATHQAALRLRARGLLVPGIRPPTVPQGESLLRISLTTGHTADHLDRLVSELAILRNSGSAV